MKTVQQQVYPSLLVSGRFGWVDTAIDLVSGRFGGVDTAIDLLFLSLPLGCQAGKCKQQVTQSANIHTHDNNKQHSMHNNGHIKLCSFIYQLVSDSDQDIPVQVYQGLLVHFSGPDTSGYPGKIVLKTIITINISTLDRMHKMTSNAPINAGKRATSNIARSDSVF